MRLRRPISFAIVVTIATLLIHCHSQYRPLTTAEGCACKPTEYCTVTPPPRSGGEARFECAPLPQACGARPTCDCVGNSAIDSCRDEDGRITLMPQRDVASCDSCSKEEYCEDRGVERYCRAMPPQCDETPTCACFMATGRGRAYGVECHDTSGRIVASLPAK